MVLEPKLDRSHGLESFCYFNLPSNLRGSSFLVWNEFFASRRRRRTVRRSAAPQEREIAHNKAVFDEIRGIEDGILEGEFR
uniref:Myotubularin phosphatase domain-containing protein n=1 Tax=Steinernema glaseri TaxID=37863 RepID=A0A1I7ZL82_9BILA